MADSVSTYPHPSSLAEKKKEASFEDLLDRNWGFHNVATYLLSLHNREQVSQEPSDVQEASGETEEKPGHLGHRCLTGSFHRDLLNLRGLAWKFSEIVDWAGSLNSNLDQHLLSLDSRIKRLEYISSEIVDGNVYLSLDPSTKNSFIPTESSLFSPETRPTALDSYLPLIDTIPSLELLDDDPLNAPKSRVSLHDKHPIISLRHRFSHPYLIYVQWLSQKRLEVRKAFESKSQRRTIDVTERKKLQRVSRRREGHELVADTMHYYGPSTLMILRCQKRSNLDSEEEEEEEDAPFTLEIIAASPNAPLLDEEEEKEKEETNTNTTSFSSFLTVPTEPTTIGIKGSDREMILGPTSPSLRLLASLTSSSLQQNDLKQEEQEEEDREEETNELLLLAPPTPNKKMMNINVEEEQEEENPVLALLSPPPFNPNKKKKKKRRRTIIEEEEEVKEANLSEIQVGILDQVSNFEKGIAEMPASPSVLMAATKKNFSNQNTENSKKVGQKPKMGLMQMIRATMTARRFAMGDDRTPEDEEEEVYDDPFDVGPTTEDLFLNQN